MRNDYRDLKTENINESTAAIDRMSTLDMMRAINEEDKKVAYAVEKCIPEIAKAVDVIASAIENGGRLFYAGAGTSGRLGVVDASECPPTYGVSPELVRGIIAGGQGAMFRSVEGAEDSTLLGGNMLEDEGFSKSDVLVVLSASGGAPFCIGALEYARSIGAKTVSVSCNPSGRMNSLADISIVAETGAEVIQGSTRMKAGTAQKLILNMLSTGAMVKTGKVYGNLMINVSPTNEKLRQRAIGIIMKISGRNYETCAESLDRLGEIRAVLREFGIEN